ncbi:MAG: penicillin-binding protein activator LpoB, partial [Acidobacteriota bacterium]
MSLSTAVGLAGPEDRMTEELRKLKRSRGARPAEVLLPDLSLSGKILQRNLYVDRWRQQVEYYLQLTL